MCVGDETGNADRCQDAAGNLLQSFRMDLILHGRRLTRNCYRFITAASIVCDGCDERIAYCVLRIQRGRHPSAASGVAGRNSEDLEGVLNFEKLYRFFTGERWKMNFLV